MSRTTIVQVRAAFNAYRRQLDTMGMDTSQIELIHTTAAGYRVVKSDGNGGPGTRTGGHLGFTASEAYTVLMAMTRAMNFATTWSVENFERVNR
jgi:hypothetical protein